MQNIEKRIEALEQKNAFTEKLWLRIICESNETPEQAAKRQGIKFDQEKYNYLVRTIVAPGDKCQRPSGLLEVGS